MSEEMTVGDYARRWLTATTIRRKPRTAETYAAVLRDHLLPMFGAVPLPRLNREAVRALLLAKLGAGYAPETVRLMLKVLRALLNAARFEDGLVAENATERLHRLLPPRRPRRDSVRALSPAETDRLLRALATFHPDLAVLSLVGGRCGLRLGELLGLQWADVDLEHRALCVRRSLDWRYREGTPKGGRETWLPLSPRTAQALRALRHRTANGFPWVFHGPSGRPWCRSYVWRTFRRACRQAGIWPVSVHALRSTFITRLAEQGENPWVIRDLARHRSIVTTEGYLRPELRHRPAVNRLDR